LLKCHLILTSSKIYSFFSWETSMCYWPFL